MIEKNKRIEDRKLLDTFHEQKCAVSTCRYKSDPAHVKTRGSGGHDLLFNVLNLCRFHHVQSGAIGWVKFCKIFPEIERELKLKNWEIKDVFGVKKLVRID